MRISTVAGIDVGYGNVKVCLTDSRGKREIVLPAGAARSADMPRRASGEPDLKGGEEVMIDGEKFVAGVEQLHIQHSARTTHSLYTSTDTYYALYLAALSKLQAPSIDVLYTGLPVKQFYGPDGESLRDGLIKKLSGRKNINAHTTVSVNEVRVIPQPLGTFMSLAENPKHKDLVTRDDLCTLVIDPGYFSVDWVLLSGKSVLHKSSSSTTLATSVILERTAHRLTATAGREITRDQLDAALRQKKAVLTVGLDRELPFAHVLAEEALSISRTVMADVLSSLRTTNVPVDVVIVTGGGGSLYAPGVAEAFNGGTLILPEDPVLANARGYRVIAEHRASKGQVPASSARATVSA